MDFELQGIRTAMFHLINETYPYVETLKLCRFSIDDILDQLIMENIIIEYQYYAERKSIRQHRIDNNMTQTEEDENASAQRYARLLSKANHYKEYNQKELCEATGHKKIDLTTNELDGPSNWQNSYSLTEIDFHELMMQDECKLLPKIFEHKLTSKDGVPNPMFKELFANYQQKIDELYDSMDMRDPNSIIAKTSEYFNLQRLYNIEFFYDLTLEAEKNGFPKEIPYDRIWALCGRVYVIPPTEWFPYEINGAENRMLMKRGAYCADIYTLSDIEWIIQFGLILDCLRLKEMVRQLKGGYAFLPYFHDLSAQTKADFIREKYWLWDNRKSFDWTNRKRIQNMRDLYDKLTMQMPKPESKKS